MCLFNGLCESYGNLRGLIIGLSLACCILTKLVVEIFYIQIMCGEFMGGVWFKRIGQSENISQEGSMKDFDIT